MLIMMLSLSALWFCLAMLEGGLQFQMEWMHVLISVLVATFVGLFAAALFRLMFSATRSLRSRRTARPQPWQFTFWVKFLLMLPLSLFCSMAVQLYLLGHEHPAASGSKLRLESATSTKITESRQSDALEELYVRLAKVAAAGSDREEDAQNLRLEIDAMRESRALRNAEHDDAQLFSLGVVKAIDVLWEQRLGLTVSFSAIFVFLFCAPLVVWEISEQGSYEYLDEYQGIVSLAARRIIPNAELLWLGEHRHYVDRFHRAEDLTVSKFRNHRDLRVRVKRGLDQALQTNKQKYQAQRKLGS
jgi:hypothetical protein